MNYFFGRFFGILLLASPAWAYAESGAKDIRHNNTSIWAAIERDVVKRLSLPGPLNTLDG